MQLEQDDDPALEYEPATQLSHTKLELARLTNDMVPAGQFVHEADLLPDQVPGMQLMHAVLDEAANMDDHVPALQERQTDEPENDHVPGPQTRQI